MSAQPNSTNNKWLGIGLVASVVLVAILVLPSLVPLTTIPPKGWLIASLLGALAVYIGGELLIKKWGLADFSAKATRVAFAFGALVVAFIGISQIWSGGLPSIGPSYLQTIMSFLGFQGPAWWMPMVSNFAMICIAVMFFVGVVHHFKDGAPIVTKTTATIIVSLAIIVLVMNWFLTPAVTTELVNAAQHDAQCAARSVIKNSTVCQDTALDWEALLNPDSWYKIGFVLICAVAPFVVFNEYRKRNKWAVYPLLAVALIITIGGTYAILKRSEIAQEVYEDASGALGAANEALNPALGESREVHLEKGSTGTTQGVEVGVHDTITVFMPAKGCNFPAPDGIMPSDHWLSRHGNATWFDPDTFIVRDPDTFPNKRLYTLSETMKKGMKEDEVGTVDIVFKLSCRQ